MAAGVVTVGRTRYAVGLYWENSPGGGRVTQIAKEAARQPGQQADFYVVRSGNKDGRIPQFGLSTSEAGQVAGMPVMAACLANQIPGSWAGAFRLNEGVVVFVVRDDLIVPDGDLFFADEAEARDRLIQEVGFGDLQATYAPESWSIPGADTIPLTLLLNDHREVTLQRVTMPKQVKIAAGAAAALFLIILGGLWYWQAKTDEENLLRAQQEEALRRIQQNNNLPQIFQSNKPPEPVYDRKWETAPPALAIIDACARNLPRVPAVILGWKLSGLKCSGTAYTVNWVREKGISVPPPGSTITDNAAGATQVIALDGINVRGPEALANPDDITKRYLLQNWPGTIARMTDDPLPLPPPGYTGPWNPPPPPWIKRSFTLNVPELPADLPQVLGGLPGVVVTNMSYTPGGISGTWSVEGVIYENRK